MRPSNSYILVFFGLLIILVGGIVAAVILESWLIVAALIPAVAAWLTRFVLLYKRRNPTA